MPGRGFLLVWVKRDALLFEEGLFIKSGVYLWVERVCDKLSLLSDSEA